MRLILKRCMWRSVYYFLFFENYTYIKYKNAQQYVNYIYARMYYKNIIVKQQILLFQLLYSKSLPIYLMYHLVDNYSSYHQMKKNTKSP